MYKDRNGVLLSPGRTILWMEGGVRRVGDIVADDRYSGGMRVGGRSVSALYEDADGGSITVVTPVNP